MRFSNRPIHALFKLPPALLMLTTCQCMQKRTDSVHF
jgi:hypothetical protein